MILASFKKYKNLYEIILYTFKLPKSPVLILDIKFPNCVRHII